MVDAHEIINAPCIVLYMDERKIVFPYFSHYKSNLAMSFKEFSKLLPTLNDELKQKPIITIKGKKVGYMFPCEDTYNTFLKRIS